MSGNDVYTAGSVTTTSNGTTHLLARVWKNGNVTTLNTYPRDAEATSVFVEGSDVYVAGYQTSQAGFRVATVWKNGIPISLSNNTEDEWATAVFASNGNVYVSGFREGTPQLMEQAKVWKNGVEMVIGSPYRFTIATSVFVSNNDVYVGGSQTDSLGVKPQATIWKNGVVHFTDTATVYGSSISSVFVKDSVIYAVGQDSNTAGDRAKLWTNGIGTFLTSPSTRSIGLGLYVN